MAIEWVRPASIVHNFCYLILITANRDHIQIKQGLNRRKGGHNGLVKSYEKLRQETQSLITAGKAPCGGQVPLELQRCKEETERLNHERMTMHLWLQAEKDELSYASSIGQGSS